MWNLPLPSCSALATFKLCVEGIRNDPLKEKFFQVLPEVEKADNSFRNAAEKSNSAHLDPSHFRLSGITIEEASRLYDRRMAAKRSPGRQIYDSIRVSSRNGKCPLCGHREVMTVDHHLPKSIFPALTVNPANLVPACTDCNQAKASKITPTLHPYFDRVEDEKWLFAKILPSIPATAFFYVSCPKPWPKDLSNKVFNHFNVFEISKLYASQAARTISGIRSQLVCLFDSGGGREVQRYLADQEKTWTALELNCWETALYAGLASSNWFYEGGFSLT